jgi:hypothetical protein
LVVPQADPEPAAIQRLSILEHMKVLDGISDGLATWLLAQPMFFVATAPLAEDGHVNLSPKGMDGTFAVLGPHQVGYLDYFGSGSETIAHLRENGRITVMFSAFEGPPNIVRLYGRGSFILPGEAAFDELRGRFSKDRTTGQRSIVLIDLDRVQESCGYSVPKMALVEQRDILDLYQEKKGPEAYVDSGQQENAVSIDGLPALDGL